MVSLVISFPKLTSEVSSNWIDGKNDNPKEKLNIKIRRKLNANFLFFIN